MLYVHLHIEAFFGLNAYTEFKFFGEYFESGFFEKDHVYHSLLAVKALIIIFAVIYLTKIIDKVSKTIEKTLVRHQNLIVVSLFYMFAFFIIMSTSVNVIEKHPVHVVLYHSLPTLYTVVLLFLFSVSPRGTNIRINSNGDVQVSNQS